MSNLSATTKIEEDAQTLLPAKSPKKKSKRNTPALGDHDSELEYMRQHADAAILTLTEIAMNCPPLSRHCYQTINRIRLELKRTPAQDREAVVRAISQNGCNTFEDIVDETRLSLDIVLAICECLVQSGQFEYRAEGGKTLNNGNRRRLIFAVE